MEREISFAFSCEKDALYVIDNDILYSDEEVAAAREYLSDKQ